MEKDKKEEKVEVVETITANNNVSAPKNNMALAGFICSISGLITCGIVSIVGLILSIVGLNKSKELNGEGRGLAIAGIVIGAIETISVIIITFFMIFFFSIAIPDVVEGVDRVYTDGIEEEDDDYACLVSFRDTNDNLIMSNSVLGYEGASYTRDAQGNNAIKLSISDKNRLFTVTSNLSKQPNNLLVVWTNFDSDSDSYETESEYCGTYSSDCLGVVNVKSGMRDDLVISGDFTKEEAMDIVDCINNY